MALVVILTVCVCAVSEPDCEIVQLAARCGSAVFNRYIWPASKSVSIGAAGVHKIAVDRDRGHMYVRGQLVQHVDEQCAVTELADFICRLPGAAAVVLTAHNGRRFDFPRFVVCMPMAGFSWWDSDAPGPA